VLSFALEKEDGSEFIDIKDEQPWVSLPRGEIKSTSDTNSASANMVSACNSNSVPMPVRWDTFSEICSKTLGLCSKFEGKLNKST
jgi:hypothetical protein